jgi:hypothetical protein
MSRDAKNRFRPTLDALEDRLVLSSAGHHAHPVHPAHPHHPAHGHHSHAGETEVHHNSAGEAETNHTGGHP